MHQYEHSRVFDSMKTIKESIDTNYTSLQYLQTLDQLLWQAVKPIALECPLLFKTYLCKVVAKQSLKASAKFTSNEKQKLPVQLFNCLVSQTEDQMLEKAKKMYINRGLLFGFTAFFLNQLKLYRDLNQSLGPYSSVARRSLINQIEQQLGLRPHGLLYQAILEVEYWDKKARWWKELIVQKYTRMTIVQAQRTYEDYNRVVRLDDVVQIYMMILNRAIDRCDSRLGVLTTFIQSWFKSAKGEVAQMAEAQQESSYEGLIEENGDGIHDILGVSMPDLTSELWQHIAFLGKKCDPQGLVRTVMHIPQYVDRKHKELLMEFVDESATVSHG